MCHGLRVVNQEQKRPRLGWGAARPGRLAIYAAADGDTSKTLGSQPGMHACMHACAITADIAMQPKVGATEPGLTLGRLNQTKVGPTQPGLTLVRLHVQTQPKVGPSEPGLTLGRLNRLRQNQDGAVHKRPEYAQCQIVQLHESNENGITLCLQHAFDNTHNTKYGSQVCRFGQNFAQNSDLLSIPIEGNRLFRLLDGGLDAAFEKKGAKQNGSIVD